MMVYAEPSITLTYKDTTLRAAPSDSIASVLSKATKKPSKKIKSCELSYNQQIIAIDQTDLTKNKTKLQDVGIESGSKVLINKVVYGKAHKEKKSRISATSVFIGIIVLYGVIRFALQLAYINKVTKMPVDEASHSGMGFV